VNPKIKKDVKYHVSLGNNLNSKKNPIVSSRPINKRDNITEAASGKRFRLKI
jgi:hypothetical protein